MVRGEVYFVDLAPRSGSEQRGRRPCVIVSHNTFSSAPAWRTVTVMPLTSSPRWCRESPTTVLFHKGECGLPKACAALAHQITTVNKGKIAGSPIGRLSPEQQFALDAAVRNYLLL